MCVRSTDENVRCRKVQTHLAGIFARTGLHERCRRAAGRMDLVIKASWIEVDFFLPARSASRGMESLYWSGRGSGCGHRLLCSRVAMFWWSDVRESCTYLKYTNLQIKYINVGLCRSCVLGDISK
jgi:hypothetical protein